MPAVSDGSHGRRCAFDRYDLSWSARSAKSYAGENCSRKRQCCVRRGTVSEEMLSPTTHSAREFAPEAAVRFEVKDRAVWSCSGYSRGVSEGGRHSCAGSRVQLGRMREGDLWRASLVRFNSRFSGPSQRRHSTGAPSLLPSPTESRAPTASREDEIGRLITHAPQEMVPEDSVRIWAKFEPGWRNGMVGAVDSLIGWKPSFRVIS